MLAAFLVFIGIVGAGLGFRKKMSGIHLEKMLLDQTDRATHCLIDIRDFITSSRKPVTEANNIPLSYLTRRAKEQELCNKKVVLITDDIKSARAAARIIRKNQENQQSFYYILQ